MAPGRPGSVRQSLRILRRDTGFLLFCAAFALADLTLAQWAVTFSLFSSGSLGLPYSLIGLGFAVNGAVVVFGQVPMTQLAIGRRHTTLAAAGVSLYIVAFLALGAAALLPSVAVAVFLVAVIVLTVGENLTSIPQTTVASNAAPPAEIGAYNGVFGTIGGVGFLVALVLGGVVLAAVHNPLEMWAVLCAPGVPAMFLFRVAGRRLSSSSNRA